MRPILREPEKQLVESLDVESGPAMYAREERVIVQSTLADSSRGLPRGGLVPGGKIKECGAKCLFHAFDYAEKSAERKP